MLLPVTFIPSMLYGGGSPGAGSCHLRTTRSAPHGALQSDGGPSPSPFSPRATPLPMPQVYRPLSNVPLTTTCNAASWPMAFCAGCDTCQKALLLPLQLQAAQVLSVVCGPADGPDRSPTWSSVIPWAPTRQWVVSVPIPLRYWTASSEDLTAKVHTIIRTTIAQYYVNQAVKRGIERQKVQAGSVTFIQRSVEPSI